MFTCNVVMATVLNFCVYVLNVPHFFLISCFAFTVVAMQLVFLISQLPCNLSYPCLPCKEASLCKFQTHGAYFEMLECENILSNDLADYHIVAQSAVYSAQLTKCCFFVQQYREQHQFEYENFSHCPYKLTPANFFHPLLINAIGQRLCTLMSSVFFDTKICRCLNSQWIYA